jgi:DNA primase
VFGGFGWDPGDHGNAGEACGVQVPGQAGARAGGLVAGGVAAEVKGKLSIVDVIGETVDLRKAGSAYKGLCPFHGEKTPSFTVTPARESWKCFGCGLGGDMFSFVMQRDSVGFPEALRILARKAGVEIDERSKREDAHRARLRDVLESAIAFYHAVLTTSKVGGDALDYLRGRGFSDETIQKFQLGWAPAGWDTMSRRLIDKRGIAPADLAEVGLTTPRASGNGAYDRFRERVIFPIRDQSGQAVGLGGRILPQAGANENAGDRGPKYLNSPGTPLFDKSRTLYLVDRAKAAIRKSGQAVIVEGYTDALMAHQAGFDNVVASLGTALTPGQVALLTRYATRIALAYDVDPAGEKAGTFGARALEELIRQLGASESGVELDEVRVVRLPDGKDPDEVVRDDPARWTESVRAAQPIVDYLIDDQSRHQDLKTAGGRDRFVRAIMPTIRAVPSPVLRDAYLQKVRQVSGVEERVLREVLQARPGGLSPMGPGPAERGRAGGGDTGRINVETVTHAPDALPIGEILRGVAPQEVELLRLLLLVPEEQVRVVELLGPDQLPSTIARELFRAIVLARETNDQGVRPPYSLDALLAGLDPETQAFAQALLAKREPDFGTLERHDLDYEVERLIIDLEVLALDERSDYNQAALAEAEHDADAEALNRLMAERQAINEHRRSLHRRLDQTRLLTRPMAGRPVAGRT